jgi:8-oxo-dGTP pyrophosphatase MutT (NUDIX family)
LLPESTGIVVINDKDEVALVGQWRYTHNKYSWEIPTGGFSPSDRDALDAAKRELKEETGIVADRWTPLGSIDNSNGATTDVAHLFLAQDLSYEDSHQEAEEQIETKWIPFAEAVEFVMNGEITESCSVAAILKVDRIRHSTS